MNSPAIFWFQNDLRLRDNALFKRCIAENTQVIALYHFQPNIRWCQQAQWGVQRTRFLLESLRELDHQLQELDGSLNIIEGNGVDPLYRLIKQYRVDRLYKAHTVGSREHDMLDAIQNRCESLQIIQDHSESLFGEAQLPFELGDTPRQFTPFRKRVEKLLIAEPDDAPQQTSTEFVRLSENKPFNEWRTRSPIAIGIQHIAPHPRLLLRGGEHAGQQALGNYLSHPGAVLRYKETRNALDEPLASTRLSLWLANGSLSPRDYYQQVRGFEQEYRSNDSTYWLIFELLWREFFYWRGLADGAKLFRLSGVRGKKPLITFNPQAFTAWCNANTPSELVNALIKQLIATGWMSNRGRQIAASYLINEYQMDWRYGAAFFEKHLIDYSAGSNYGNWQYIAGVGTDPRGGRHFNIDKQREIYDPDGTFARSWDGRAGDPVTDVVDAADWPIH